MVVVAAAASVKLKRAFGLHLWQSEAVDRVSSKGLFSEAEHSASAVDVVVVAAAEFVFVSVAAKLDFEELEQEVELAAAAAVAAALVVVASKVLDRQEFVAASATYHFLLDFAARTAMFH